MGSEKMRKLIIKIGGSMEEDLKQVYKNPKLGKPGTHTSYLKNRQELYELLSPQRLELLRYVTCHPEEQNTIGHLSKKLKRKQEAISRDASFLEKHEMLKKIKEKQSVYLKALYGSLDLKIANTC
jgi:predicted transcriptional regulator